MHPALRGHMSLGLMGMTELLQVQPKSTSLGYTRTAIFHLCIEIINLLVALQMFAV